MRRVPRVAARTLASSVLPTPASPFEEQRAAELEGQEDRGRERPVGDVVAGAEVLLDGLDGPGAGGALVAVAHRRTLTLPPVARRHFPAAAGARAKPRPASPPGHASLAASALGASSACA